MTNSAPDFTARAKQTAGVEAADMPSNWVVAGCTLLIVLLCAGYLMGKSNGLRSLPASSLDFDSAEQITVQDVVATTPSPTLPTTSSPLSPPSTLPLTKATCQWSFSRYESSAFELEWFKLIQADRMCTNVCNDGLLFVDAHANQTFAVLRLAHQITLRLPHAFADYALFSRLHYTLTCPDASRNKVGVQLIEPLYGILRDPCDRFCNGKGHCPSQLTNRIGQGQSKAHMILLGDAPFKVAAPGEDAFASEQGWEVGRGFIAPWHCRSVEPCTLIKRGLFFDLGAALFGGWHGAVVAGDKDGAASQAFLYGRYHLRNVTITNLYSMELTGYSPSDVFSQMPADLIPALHWMNVPVSDEVGNKLNPLTTLKALRQADNHDLTVIKLDIDAWTIENALVDQLLADTKGEFGIVDEFHYEHHVNCAPMNGDWCARCCVHPRRADATHRNIHKPRPDMADSYDMFKQIRLKGIRAHSWP